VRRRAGFAAVLLALAGCGADLGEALRGRWEMDADRVEFLDEGRVLLIRHGEAALGEYAVPEADRLVLAFGPPLTESGAGDYRVRVEGDTARLCESDRPHRCMALVRARGEWREPAGAWRDTVPVRLATPPRPGAARDPRLVQVELALRQLHTFERVFREQEGRYTADLAELERAGWKPSPSVAGYHPPEVAAAGERLCALMRPRQPGLPPVHVQDDGRLGFGERCPAADGPTVADAPSPSAPLPPTLRPVPGVPATVPREARMAEVVPLLKQIYTLQETYQAQHGVYARTFAELETVGWQAAPLRHHHAPRIVYAHGGRLCVEVVPREAGLWPQHVDQRGQVRRGRCR
jgi:hypothetical protein